MAKGKLDRNAKRKTRVYVIEEKEHEFVKIGVALDVASRLKALQGANARDLFVAHYYILKTRKEAFALENYIHWELMNTGTRANGEWFVLTDELKRFLLLIQCKIQKGEDYREVKYNG